MPKFLRLIIIMLSAVGLTALFVLVLPAQGRLLASPQAAIVVNTLEDEDNTDGDCALREAIRAANENSAVDACIAGDVITDTITFTPSGTITLTEQLSVTAGGPLLIDGSEAITISGGGSVRIFYLDTNAALQVINLTLINGHHDDYGGGIYNLGMLSIIHSTINSNNARIGGGIYNISLSKLTIEDSLIYSNTAGWYGGGIWNYGSLTLSASILSENYAFYGGGINTGGTLTITNSTIANNTVPYYGGGINNGGTLSIANSTLIGNNSDSSAGGIKNWGKLIITNSTLSGNSATDFGGGINNSGTLTLTYSTLSGNSAADGGGIYNYSGNEVALSASIVAYSPSGVNCAGDPITDIGYNIEDTDTCGLDAGSSLPNTDPLLGPIQDNGGPTLTHALLEGSSAIDVADPVNCPPNDQRGVPRPIDGDVDGEAICDIGSFEYQFPTTITILEDLPDPSKPGQPFSVTFHVTANLGGPTGVVTITAGASHTSCSDVLVDGMGACALILDSPGTYTLIATYSGNEQYAPSSTTVLHMVSPFKTYLPFASK